MMVNAKVQETQAVDATDMLALLRAHLPPVIARKKVEYFLGGIVSASHLAKADSRGTGPDVAYNVGDCVVYETESLLQYVAARWPVQFRDKDMMGQLLKTKRPPRKRAPGRSRPGGGGSASGARNAQSV